MAWTNAGTWARRVPLEVVQEAIRLVYPRGVPEDRERAHDGGLVVYKLEHGEAKASLARRPTRPKAPAPPPPLQLPPTDDHLADELTAAIHDGVGDEAFGRYFRTQVLVRATAAAVVLLVPTGMVAELLQHKFAGAIAGAVQHVGISSPARWCVEARAFQENRP